MYTQIRETINNTLSKALKEGIGGAMKDAAEQAIQGILGRFVGDILDEYDFERYCDHMAWDIAQVVDNMMRQVFDKPVDKEDENDD